MIRDEKHVSSNRNRSAASGYFDDSNPRLRSDIATVPAAQMRHQLDHGPFFMIENDMQLFSMFGTEFGDKNARVETRKEIHHIA